MRDILPSLEKWHQDGQPVAVATVVETWGSAPRPVGSKLATSLSGGIAGSVSAGCVEGAVIEESKAVMQSGRPRLLSFGVADDDAWQVGLACGGTIKVFVEPFTALASVYPDLKRHLQARQPLALVSVLEGTPDLLNRKLLVLPDGSAGGDLPLADHQQAVTAAALELLERGEGGRLQLDDGTGLFIEVYPPVPRLIIIGATHIAGALVTMAGVAGFDTYVIDPRGAFANRERFPHATHLVKEWPQHALANMQLDSSAYVVLLTHDPKFDDPSLQAALSSQARYVGALGSRRTNRKRIERLRRAGLSEQQLARLHAPVGLPLGGRSPAEIALSIMAEVVQVKNSALARTPSHAAGEGWGGGEQAGRSR